jgi:hypothetical protein
MALFIMQEDSRILIKKGRVVRAETWYCWNGLSWPTIVIQRIGKVFECIVQDPDGGIDIRRGRLDQVLEKLYPSLVTIHTTLFCVDNLTPRVLAAIGFDRYKIEYIDEE